MSHTIDHVFDESSQQLRVLLPPLKKLPPSPHIYIKPNFDEILARAIAPHSETEQTDSESLSEPIELKELHHLLLACDQRSISLALQPSTFRQLI